MKIPYVNFYKQYLNEEKKLVNVFKKIVKKGEFVTSQDEVLKFENNLKKNLNTKYALALNSGTDALTLALFAIGIKRGDEVITASNSFIASTAVIIHLGAKPVFIDVKNDQNIDENLIESKITSKTKAIMPVHLTGRVCSMDKICKIARKYRLAVIEDCAQSIMSKYNNKFAGTFGNVGCFSTHPLKNLNALGDGGFLITNNKKIYDRVYRLRNHGMASRDNVKEFGFVSRMDNLQAAFLNLRLQNLKKIIKKRRENVKLYIKNLNKKNYFFPIEKNKEFNTYHTFVVQVKKRNKLKNFLKQQGIGTAIHYPTPIHLQPASVKLGFKKFNLPNTIKQSKTILTLPINQYLKKNEILYICKTINKFYENK